MIELTKDENEIEYNATNYKSVSKEKRGEIEAIISQAKKNKAISLRIANYDLEKLKEKADKEGIPYQTLLTSIIHKYLSNQLMDRDDILKSISLINNTRE